MNANETVEFFRAVAADSAKCERLKATTDLESFLKSAAEIGAEVGHTPDIERLRAVAEAAQNTSEGPEELGEDELDNIDAGFYFSTVFAGFQQMTGSTDNE